MSINLGDLVDSVSTQASLYEDALNDLISAASNNNNINIASATAATTEVQITQGMTEMISGIAKNAADYLKGLGRKIN